MADHATITSSQTSPQYTGLRLLFEDLLINYSYNGAEFWILASMDVSDLLTSYDLENSVEGKVLWQLDDLGSQEPSEENFNRVFQIRDEFAKVVGNACITLMLNLAPTTPLPEVRTLHDYMYPETHYLRVITEDGQLVGHKLHDYAPPPQYPPIPDEELKALDLDTDLPTFNASQVVLRKRFQSCIWEVDVEGELMVCKASFQRHFWNSLSDELLTYQKIRRAGDGLLVPKLKVNVIEGIVKSHEGVVGILISLIPKKHHSLRTLLQHIDHGTVSEAAASPALKKKWAGQIKHTLARLHGLGILWRDIKIDNVIIDDNDDAIVHDFGGGNTLGWVDEGKHGTVEGDLQGLEKILKILGNEMGYPVYVPQGQD
ncbi:hypothetical protein NUW58_g7437 [Xylaria curta]|uniref:Uncharacterized protein n=1 Tax=Xylaria curta TaxID=42375 RepID=A0ACC1NJ52_9PEZI|nr:hypothetical protein NUW58_g7437 [Xylaria curta]